MTGGRPRTNEEITMPIACHMTAARAVTQPVVRRSMTIAALMGASILAGALTMARAETPGSHATPSGANAATHVAQATPSQSTAGTGGGNSSGAMANETRSETVEQRIATLHTQLKITPDEEQKWDAVAKVMRENAANLDKLAADSHASASRDMTAVEDLKMYQKFAQTHVDGLKSLVASFSSLYSAMPEAQKKTADAVFQAAHQNAAAAHGQTG
jgi:hypothetical protein